MATPRPVKKEGEKTKDYRARVEAWRLMNETASKVAASKKGGAAKPTKQEGEKTKDYRNRVSTWKEAPAMSQTRGGTNYELGNKGQLGSKSIRAMKDAGMNKKEIKTEIRRFKRKGGEINERAAERIRKKGDEFDAGNVLTRRDIKAMKARGFANDKIQDTIKNHRGKVGAKAQNWLGRQAAKNQNGGSTGGQNGNNVNVGEGIGVGGDVGGDVVGGDKVGGDQISTGDGSPVSTGDDSPITTGDNSPITEGDDNIITPGDNNDIIDGDDGVINDGDDNQIGDGNQDAEDTGDIDNTFKPDNSQSMDGWKMDNDNTVKQGDNSYNHQVIDNSVTQYGSSDRILNIQGGNTGNQNGDGSGTLTDTLDGVATAGTLAGFYDVDDSPGAQAQFVNHYNDLNKKAQNEFNDPSTYAMSAIKLADQNSTIDPNKLDKRIMARENASMAQARLAFQDIWGDPKDKLGDWMRPEDPESTEEPDWENMYETMTDY